jgi:hypothetical protein
MLHLAAWSVDRLGRSLTDLLAILQALHDKGVDLFLHQQGLDTSTTVGRAMFQMLGVFAEFERGSIIRERVNAGLARAGEKGTSARCGETHTEPPREGHGHSEDCSHAGHRHECRTAGCPGDVRRWTNRRTNRSCSADAAPEGAHAVELTALLKPTLGFRARWARQPTTAPRQGPLRPVRFRRHTAPLVRDFSKIKATPDLTHARVRGTFQSIENHYVSR